MSPDGTDAGRPVGPAQNPQLPSASARAMAAVLLDVADALDENDLRAADALTEVRRSARRLAESVFARGWGELFLGLDVGPDERGTDDAVVDFDESEPWLDADEEDDGIPLPPGSRVTYQARFDFVVTDPGALMRHVTRRLQERQPIQDGPAEGDHVPADPPNDLLEAVGLLAYIDGLGARDYALHGLEFAGGQEVVRAIDSALWEMSQQHQDDHYPFE